MENMGHLLSFVTNTSGDYLAIHADLAGIDLLIRELGLLRHALLQDQVEHTHLQYIDVPGDELSPTKLENQPDEVNVVTHVKIYAWNDHWARHHKLKK
ncbi:MAG: Imm32 family immunity protein [Pirellulales bacterium]